MLWVYTVNFMYQQSQVYHGCVVIKLQVLYSVLYQHCHGLLVLASYQQPFNISYQNCIFQRLRLFKVMMINGMLTFILLHKWHNELFSDSR